MKTEARERLWRLVSAAQHARRAIASIAAALFSPPIIVVYLALAALAASVAGVLLLLGHAWALIAAAIQLYVFAIFVAKGLSRG